jgi:hypothetical protein
MAKKERDRVRGEQCLLETLHTDKNKSSAILKFIKVN